MTDEEFRADLLAATASRAEAHETSLREAFVAEVLERLREAGEVPDAEICTEALTGQRGRRLEVDAFGEDDADGSLHLFTAVRDGEPEMPSNLTLTEAKEQGFNRLLGMFEQARDGWLTRNIEESRPLWGLARRIEVEGKPAALRLHILSDRRVSERLREIPPELTREGVPVSFQIWDVSRLKRIHEAGSVRDDLFVDLSALPGGGLVALPAPTGDDGYGAYLAVIPGEALADIYIRHGSRLLESNVRTFLGRKGNINKGIANTLSKEPGRFFAFNNGLAVTASSVVAEATTGGGSVLITGLNDLQIVNGAQTTASLAAARRDGKLPSDSVFVSLKLSVVASAIAEQLVPRISRFANSQNGVRASDFFANHPFHQRMEQASRRILAPAASGSLVQTHWYYERARGQHLNDQAALTPAKKQQFLRMNPRQQVLTKTDLAKVESCFDLLPHIACKGAEKSFTAFADRVAKDWTDESKRDAYNDDWFRACVARVLLFRTAETLVSRASWYEGGYRAQVVAYSCARLALLASNESEGGRLDWPRIWLAQAADPVLERQLLHIAEVMMAVLRTPPVAGQNVTEWAKQQACWNRAASTPVDADAGLPAFLVGRQDVKSDVRQSVEQQRVENSLESLKKVIQLGGPFWHEVKQFAQARRLTTGPDEAALAVAALIPRKVPQDFQAAKLLTVMSRCIEAGFQPSGA